MVSNNSSIPWLPQIYIGAFYFSSVGQSIGELHIIVRGRISVLAASEFKWLIWCPIGSRLYPNEIERKISK